MPLKDELKIKENYYTKLIEKYEKLRDAIRLVIQEDSESDNRQIDLIAKSRDNVVLIEAKNSRDVIDRFLEHSMGNWFRVAEVLDYAVKIKFRKPENKKKIRPTISGILAEMADEKNEDRILERKEAQERSTKLFLYRRLSK